MAGLPFLVVPGGLLAQKAPTTESTRVLVVTMGKRFRELIEPVTNEQWNVRLSAARHTVGEEAEHVALSEQDLQKMVIKALRAPKNEAYAKQLEGKEAKVKDFFLGEGKAAERYTAPDRLRSKEEVLEFFGAAEKKLLDLLDSDREFLVHAAKHPNDEIGLLNALQWFHYIAWHGERHCQQIEALKAHPDYPGRVRSA